MRKVIAGSSRIDWLQTIMRLVRDFYVMMFTIFILFITCSFVYITPISYSVECLWVQCRVIRSAWLKWYFPPIGCAHDTISILSTSTSFLPSPKLDKILCFFFYLKTASTTILPFWNKRKDSVAGFKNAGLSTIYTSVKLWFGLPDKDFLWLKFYTIEENPHHM